MKDFLKCDYCSKEATRFNETRVKGDGIHREIVTVCDKHMREKVVKSNK